MNTRRTPRLISGVLAAVFTLGMLLSVDHLATSEPTPAQLARSATQPST